ncbi:uncharacterized protein LOC110973699 [Acanthaster planci]|uniref:Uncharacterized protein LOC110973699 n=1 Tax=Acanthaster planci TaxID=133434 RepID=A0A8B7XHX6_ACAPL|nr:uncharacterized protein LOC110973699 [Acanthaster planci]
MSFSSLACLLMVVIAGAQANVAQGLPFRGVYNPFSHHADEPQPCSIPRYFTYLQEDFVTTVEEGRLKVEEESWEGAYDTIAQKYSAKKEERFFNGTDDYSKIIFDEGKGVEYIIEKRGEETVCLVLDIEGQKFPDTYTFPKNAKFVGEATLGDRDLVVNVWYYPSEDNTKHTVKTYTREECVPIGLRHRKFDPQTGVEIELRESSLYDIKLGICDEEKYFKVPDECKEGRALKEPTLTMMKIRNHFN